MSTICCSEGLDFTHQRPYRSTVCSFSWSIRTQPSAVTSSHHSWSDSSEVMMTLVMGMYTPWRSTISCWTSLDTRSSVHGYGGGACKIRTEPAVR